VVPFPLHAQAIPELSMSFMLLPLFEMMLTFLMEPSPEALDSQIVPIASVLLRLGQKRVLIPIGPSFALLIMH